MAKGRKFGKLPGTGKPGGGKLKTLGGRLGGLGKGLGNFGKVSVKVSPTKFGGAGKIAKPPAPASPKPFKPKKLGFKVRARNR